MKKRTEFTDAVIKAIKSIPKGRVATYGQIAAVAGNHRASRQVAYILHSVSGKEGLPWFRVINSKGQISLKGKGYQEQKKLLKKEGVKFDKADKIDLKKYLWQPL